MNSIARLFSVGVLALGGVALMAAAQTAAPKPADNMAKPKDSMMMAHGYVPYTKAAFDAAKGMQRVLFFHAAWCPTCKAANADLTAKQNDIPKNVVVFKTDYDNEVVLKRQYAVSYQHTFVLVDAGGKALKTWSGGALTEILANLTAK